MDMQNLLDTRISEIEDADIHKLLEELEMITRFSLEEMWKQPLCSYLYTCLYHSPGKQRRLKITPDDLNTHDPYDEYLLRKKIRKLPASVYWLCNEIVKRLNPYGRNDSVEVYDTRTLYAFLNDMLPNFERPKRRVIARHFY